MILIFSAICYCFVDNIYISPKYLFVEKKDNDDLKKKFIIAINNFHTNINGTSLQIHLTIPVDFYHRKR